MGWGKIIDYFLYSSVLTDNDTMSFVIKKIFNI